jgi:hypothetical protein
MLKFESNLFCAPCRLGKMITTSHSLVNTMMTEQPGVGAHKMPISCTNISSKCMK